MTSQTAFNRWRKYIPTTRWDKDSGMKFVTISVPAEVVKSISAGSYAT